MSWKAVAREPLVHFLVIGAALFAIDAWRGPDEEPRSVAVAPAPAVAPAVRQIVVDDTVRKNVAAAAELHLGRKPTAAELAAELERWIDEEMLFREAMSRGLDRDDPVVHERIASRMSYVLEQSAIVPEPSEAELRAWFDAHRETWNVPDRIDFTHVFVSGSDAAAAKKLADLETALAAGAPPERLGDVFSGGHKYRGRRMEDLAQSFGAEFVDGLDKQPLGTWVKHTSRHGLHLVRVDQRSEGRQADFEQARLDVRKAWHDDRLRRELKAAIDRLRTQWEIVQR
ncbi:MAG: peptidyl-prolyl cis-trans isomerase [Kofleriaceae bacterium]|nr:peptidyl-prolyl cis-trans isomerase [Kofleriaceae bacterium]